MSAQNELDQALTEEGTPFYSRRRPVIAGSFNIARVALPYFVTTMTIEEVTKELGLVESLPSDLRSKWRLEELFQREIDWARVEHEIVNGYLRRPEKLQFFNSLTVALLPTDEQRMLERSYGIPVRPPEAPEHLRKGPWLTRNVGNVQLTTNDKSPNGYISWNPKRIFPATIDGQHRLAALQELYRRGNLAARQLETTVSVLLLVLDEAAGFKLVVSARALRPSTARLCSQTSRVS